MLYQIFLRKERAKLRALEIERARTSIIIKAEQAALKQELMRGLGSGKGLLFSFAAGCAVSLTIKHGAKAVKLRHFPLSNILALASLYGQLKGTE